MPTMLKMKGNYNHQPNILSLMENIMSWLQWVYNLSRPNELPNVHQEEPKEGPQVAPSKSHFQPLFFLLSQEKWQPTLDLFSQTTPKKLFFSFAALGKPQPLKTKTRPLCLFFFPFLNPNMASPLYSLFPSPLIASFSPCFVRPL